MEIQKKPFSYSRSQGKNHKRRPELLFLLRVLDCLEATKKEAKSSKKLARDYDEEDQGMDIDSVLEYVKMD